MKKVLFALAAAVLACAACSKDLVLEVDNQSFTISSKGDTITVSVNCNKQWEMQYYEYLNTWCHYSVGDPVKDVTKITFIIDANDEAESREAEYTFVSGDLKQTVTITQSAFEVSEDAMNLSAAGTANCYIVAPGSKAYFNAGVKGNSTESVGSVVRAKLLWQSEEGLVKSIKFAPAACQFEIETADVPGNAVIAAVSVENTVLWSWHIWVVDYDPSTSLYSTPANASGTVWQFMDRNLGATSTTKGDFANAGVYYQWGRKDPFPGAVDFTVQNEDYSYQQDGEPTLYNFENNVTFKISNFAEYEGSIEKGIANPDVFYKVGSRKTGEVDEYGSEVYENVPRSSDWSDTSDDDAWGGVSMKKTIYDPCPAGYKVPVCDADGNTPYAWLTSQKRTWEEKNRGVEQDGQWFPTNGTRVAQSGGLNYTEANAYSGLWIGTAGKANSNLDLYPTLYGQYMFIGSGKRTFKVSKDCRAQGMNVRCVAE